MLLSLEYPEHPRGSQVHLISYYDLCIGEYLMYWINKDWIQISMLLGHENAIFVFLIGHPWLFAVVVRRWSTQSITAAARYVFFSFFIITAKIWCIKWNAFISYVKTHKKAIILCHIGDALTGAVNALVVGVPRTFQGQPGTFNVM